MQIAGSIHLEINIRNTFNLIRVHSTHKGAIPGKLYALKLSCCLLLISDKQVTSSSTVIQ